MIILASASPRRKMLLESLGLPFTVSIPDIDESRLPGESPVELCVRLSLLKAEAVQRKYPSDIVIAADTIVVSCSEILCKPSDEEDAQRMLSILSGCEHEVITGLTVRTCDRVKSCSVHTNVKFRVLTDREIAAYVETGEGRDKAGGYAVQGKGALLVESILGDYYNVVGLPLCTLGEMLLSFGISLL